MDRNNEKPSLTGTHGRLFISVNLSMYFTHYVVYVLAIF